MITTFPDDQHNATVRGGGHEPHKAGKAGDPPSSLDANTDRAETLRPPVQGLGFPASDRWYEGALLGNGDIGLVVYTAEDELIFSVGKNDVWDRRHHYHMLKPMTFRQFMKKVKTEWPFDPATGMVRVPPDIFEAYEPLSAKATEAEDLLKPNPKPVCTIGLRQLSEGAKRPLGRLKQVLSLEEAELLTKASLFSTSTRVQKNAELVLITVHGVSERMVLSLRKADDSTQTGIQPALHTIEDGMGVILQKLPPERTYPRGFQYSVVATLLGGKPPVIERDEIRWILDGDCTLVLAVATTRDDPRPVTLARRIVTGALRKGEDRLRQEHLREWKLFWDASWIRIDDPRIERTWYFHNYLLASASRPGAIAPGLFGPWIVRDSSAWNGSYTTDYNFEQTYAAALCCNHPELMHSYFETLEDMLPAAREFARNIYEAEGIAFPHEIYPIDMRGQMFPSEAYIVETPYLVQHFWEYYEYTQDEEFLVKRAYPMVSACADFLSSYATYEGDGKYAFEPTRSCEHHGLIHGLPFNRNGTPELAFARYVFKAALRGASIVGETEERQERWKRVLHGLPDYPRTRNQLGEVFLDCEAADESLNVKPPPELASKSRPSKTPGNDGAWMTYNVPTSLFNVWPGEQIDSDSSPRDLLTAIRTWMTLKTEGSNDLVSRHMIAARIGITTFEQFKKDIEERSMVNGAVTTMFRPFGSTTLDEGYFAYQENGIYVENCGIPQVINEIMLQSHNHIIRLFPAMDPYRTAEFHNLRARGGFLISAAIRMGFVLWARIVPTVDRRCRLRPPWPPSEISIREIRSGEPVNVEREGDDVCFQAKRGRTYEVTPAASRPGGSHVA